MSYSAVPVVGTTGSAALSLSLSHCASSSYVAWHQCFSQSDTVTPYGNRYDLVKTPSARTLAMVTIDYRASVVDRFLTLRTGENVRREFIIPLELSAEELAALLQPPADSAARAAICQVLRRLVLAAQKEILGSQQWLCFCGAGLATRAKKAFFFCKNSFRERDQPTASHTPAGACPTRI